MLNKVDWRIFWSFWRKQNNFSAKSSHFDGKICSFGFSCKITPFWRKIELVSTSEWNYLFSKKAFISRNFCYFHGCLFTIFHFFSGVIGIVTVQVWSFTGLVSLTNLTVIETKEFWFVTIFPKILFIAILPKWILIKIQLK